MRLIHQILLAFALTVGAIVLTLGVGRAGDVTVENPMVRVTIPGRPAAGFLVMVNRAADDDRLVAVATPRAREVQMHSMTMTDGVMKMAPVDGIAVPAGGSAELKPGGYHLMIFGLDEAVKAGDKLPLTLTFEKAGEITVDAQVTAIGGAAQ